MKNMSSLTQSLLVVKKSIKSQYRNHFIIVQVLTEGRIFEVQSESVTSDLKAKYIVDFGNINEICSCTCRGFRRDRLPCTFFLSLMQDIEHLNNYLLFFWSIR